MSPQARDRGLALLALALSAWALWRVLSPPSPRYPRATAALFERLDPDGDGRISAAEYGLLAPPDQPLERYDIDGDEALAPWEIELLYLAVDPTWSFEAPH